MTNFSLNNFECVSYARILFWALVAFVFGNVVIAWLLQSDTFAWWAV